MPQELYVVRCYSCKMFQVQIAKKSKKWRCKICNDEQSLRAIYFRGSTGRCRDYVQKHNSHDARRWQNDCRTVGVATWGLDCQADDETDDPCDCGDKKSSIEKLSRCIGDADDSRTAKEDSSPLTNPAKRYKLDNGAHRARSLPSRINLPSRQAFRKERTFSQSPTNNGAPSKWEKFLAEEESEENSPSKSSSGSPFVSGKDEETAEKTDGGEQTFCENNSNGSQLDGEESGEFWGDGELKCSRVDASSLSTKSQTASSDYNLFGDLQDRFDDEIDF